MSLTFLLTQIGRQTRASSPSDKKLAAAVRPGLPSSEVSPLGRSHPARDGRIRNYRSGSSDSARQLFSARVLTSRSDVLFTSVEEKRERGISETQLIYSGEPGLGIQGRQFGYPPPPVEVTRPGSPWVSVLGRVVGFDGVAVERAVRTFGAFRTNLADTLLTRNPARGMTHGRSPARVGQRAATLGMATGSEHARRAKRSSRTFGGRSAYATRRPFRANEGLWRVGVGCPRMTERGLCAGALGARVGRQADELGALFPQAP
jgi:hypothetical protein